MDWSRPPLPNVEFIHISSVFNLWLLPLGKPYYTNSEVFFNNVQTAFDPPHLVLNMYVANFLDELLKKCVNVCLNKIWQNNA